MPGLVALNRTEDTSEFMRVVGVDATEDGAVIGLCGGVSGGEGGAGDGTDDGGWCITAVVEFSTVLDGSGKEGDSIGATGES